MLLNIVLFDDDEPLTSALGELIDIHQRSNLTKFKSVKKSKQ